MIAYAPELTDRVIGHLADEASIEVVDSISLNVTDNRAVRRLDPDDLLPLIDRLDLTSAEALVLAACVQMPSLSSIEVAQDRTGLPTLSAATATVRMILSALDIEPTIPGAGAVLEPSLASAF